MKNRKSKPRQQPINQPQYQNYYELNLKLLKYLVNELKRAMDHGMIRCESIDSVQNDIDQKQFEISKLKEKISKIESYIQRKRDHLRHLKDLKN
ncbi:hypothetical protein OAM01_02030 [bacterium]|nr:hypothetical protein [bacterium]